jgi:hypothetical protein
MHRQANEPRKDATTHLSLTDMSELARQANEAAKEATLYSKLLVAIGDKRAANKFTDAALPERLHEAVAQATAATKRQPRVVQAAKPTKAATPTVESTIARYKAHMAKQTAARRLDYFQNACIKAGKVAG